MTKSIVTAAALMLHDEGKLNVNDPVSKYISELKVVRVTKGDDLLPATREMTIADLMRHTAGSLAIGAKTTTDGLISTITHNLQ